MQTESLSIVAPWAVAPTVVTYIGIVVMRYGPRRDDVVQKDERGRQLSLAPQSLLE